MAHRIIYKPSGIILSSTLSDIAIAVEGDYVDVLLITTAQTILSERYYAYGGNVILCLFSYSLRTFTDNYNTMVTCELSWPLFRCTFFPLAREA